MKKNAIPVAVVGASGYAGAELTRLLHEHPGTELSFVCGNSRAGEAISSVLPSFAGTLAQEVTRFDADAIADACLAVFCALPHGASAPIVAQLRAEGIVVFDLSADFRLEDAGVYQRWYGEHGAPALFGSGVYGLPELHRESIRTAELVAVPGCYPTASTLALAPLISGGLVDTHGIIVDAKSGVSGAGRTARPNTHLPECSEGLRAYKVGGTHRHTPEIEQNLSRLAGEEVKILFTPHLVPMTRGILATSYAIAKEGVTVAQCITAARALYEGSPSVVVSEESGACPDTLWARGTNRAFVSYALDERTGRVVAQCAIDNLVKGAAGQAVQCFNLRFGFDEGEGLRALARWP